MCLMCVSVGELYKGLSERRMIMDLLMMWHMLMDPFRNAGLSV